MKITIELDFTSKDGGELWQELNDAAIIVDTILQSDVEPEIEVVHTLKPTMQIGTPISYPPGVRSITPGDLHIHTTNYADAETVSDTLRRVVDDEMSRHGYL